MKKKQPKKQKPSPKNEVVVREKEKPSIWVDKDAIRRQFGQDLTEPEFNLFFMLGSALQANPFLREIWAVKYDRSRPASIFCGRDFYRRKAQEQSDYDGHMAAAIYQNDDFSMHDGEPRHVFTMKNRGELLGAYCLVRRKGIRQPFVVTVNLKDYNQNHSLWSAKKDTMITKVAEAQALRGAYQGLFKGTYDESEAWVIDQKKSDQIARATEPTNADDNQILIVAANKIKAAKTVDEVIEIDKRAQAAALLSDELKAKIHMLANAVIDATLNAKTEVDVEELATIHSAANVRIDQFANEGKK